MTKQFVITNCNDNREKKIRLSELDSWYKVNAENSELGDAFQIRNISWSDLSYDRKLAIYESSQPAKIRGNNGSRHKDHDDYKARNYHQNAGVVDYFKRNRLNHESGDYRTLVKKGLYYFWFAWYWLSGNQTVTATLHLSDLNNLHCHKSFKNASKWRDNKNYDQ